MTADRDFLFWLRDRLVHHYGESENIDFVHKLEAVAEVTPPHLDTPSFRFDSQKGKRFRIFGASFSSGPRWYIYDFADGKIMLTFDSEDQANAVCSWFNLFHQANEDLQKSLPKEGTEPPDQTITD